MSLALKRSLPNKHVQMDRGTIINHLRKVQLFEDIKSNDLALIALSECLDTRQFSPATSILEEGSAGDSMFILIEGQASVYKSTPEGDKYKVIILNGQSHVTFGEGGLIQGEQRSATVITDSECHCLVLDRESFEKYSEKYPSWALPVYRRIAQGLLSRLRKTNDDMLLLYKALVTEIRGS